MTPYCVMPFVHIKQFTNTIYGPCCEFENQHYTDQPQTGDTNLLDSFNHEYFKNIRKEMLNGQIPKGCARCVGKEKLHAPSYRQWANKTFKITEAKIEQNLKEVRGLDISFSNECNLSCRMCQPEYSTKWYRIWPEFDKQTKHLNMSLYHNNVTPWKANNDNLEKLINLNYIKIMGGEPFISKEHTEFILNIPDNMIKNLSFEYTTNSTIFPNKELEKKLSYAKGGPINLSIDGIGKLNEYIRPGVDWKQIDSVVKKWFLFMNKNPQWKIEFAPCWQALNAHHLDDYIDYVLQYKSFYEGHPLQNTLHHGHPWIGTNRVVTPEPLTIYALPKKYKDKIVNQYLKRSDYKQTRNTLIEYLRDDSKHVDIEDFNTFNKVYDSIMDLEKHEIF